MTPSTLTIAQEGLRLAEKATKGPWHVSSHGQYIRYRQSDGTAPNICDLNVFAGPEEEEEANRNLIAHCGTHYADICRELIRLHAEIARLKNHEFFEDGLECDLNESNIDTPAQAYVEGWSDALAALAQTGEEKT